MPILQWHDTVYAIGVEELDRQHRALVQMINDAHDACTCQAPEQMLAVVRRMAAYAANHFAAEEALMRQADYHRASPHRDDHAGFEAKVREYEDAIGRAEVPDGRGVFRYLAEWLSAHILEVDAEFGRFLRSRGGRGRAGGDAL